MEVGYLVAQIRKKPELLKSKLEELMAEVGLAVVRPVGDVMCMSPFIVNGSMRQNWSSSEVLSDEEVKVAIYDVYSCYRIASKVTDGIEIRPATPGQ